MPDETLEMTADRLTDAAHVSFQQFGSALAGSGVDAAKDWEQVQIIAGSLDRLSRNTAEGIRNLQDNPHLSDFERHSRIAELNDLHKEMSRSFGKDLTASLGKVENTLLEAQRVLPESEPGERALVRGEIDQLVAGYPHTPEKPGLPMLAILHQIAQMSPKYAAEIADSYGSVKMTAAGERHDIPNLFKNVIALAAGTTPKAQAAKKAMVAMETLKVKGHANAGLQIASQYRIDAANTPAKHAGPRQWTPDTIVPRTR